MRIAVDTNVFVSGVFFSGPPYEILDAWRRGEVELVVSPPILDECERISRKLADGFGGVDHEPHVQLLAAAATMVDAPSCSSSNHRSTADIEDDEHQHEHELRRSRPFLAAKSARKRSALSVRNRDEKQEAGAVGLNLQLPGLTR